MNTRRRTPGRIQQTQETTTRGRTALSHCSRCRLDAMYTHAALTDNAAALQHRACHRRLHERSLCWRAGAYGFFQDDCGNAAVFAVDWRLRPDFPQYSHDASLPVAAILGRYVSCKAARRSCLWLLTQLEKDNRRRGQRQCTGSASFEAGSVIAHLLSSLMQETLCALAKASISLQKGRCNMA